MCLNFTLCLDFTMHLVLNNNNTKSRFDCISNVNIYIFALIGWTFWSYGIANSFEKCEHLAYLIIDCTYSVFLSLSEYFDDVVCIHIAYFFPFFYFTFDTFWWKLFFVEVNFSQIYILHILISISKYTKQEKRNEEF